MLSRQRLLVLLKLKSTLPLYSERKQAYMISMSTKYQTLRYRKCYGLFARLNSIGNIAGVERRAGRYEKRHGGAVIFYSFFQSCVEIIYSCV